MSQKLPFWLYLARPISGCTADEVYNYYKEKTEFFSDLGYFVLHPMVGKSELRCEEKFKSSDYRHAAATNHAIFERDTWMVSKADIVYLNLVDASIVSQGCLGELFTGARLGKHTIVAMPEENIHQHAFVIEAADIIFNTEDEAERYLTKLIRQEF